MDTIEEIDDIMRECIEAFAYAGELEGVTAMKAGHINKTYKLTFRVKSGKDDMLGHREMYVLQRINTGIFKDPFALMENVDKVTSHIIRKTEQEGGDVSRCTLHFCRTVNGKLVYQASNGSCWRSYRYIDNCIAYDRVEKPEHFMRAGEALGRFQKKLSDFPASELHETIPNFHNTVSRINDFKKSVARNASGRASNVQQEIEFVLERESFCSCVVDAIAAGVVPIRVTHNDTKLNNVLIDASTSQVLCLIDLDTVMPGSALYDFGDSIRFGASSAAEDEVDLDKVHFVPALYDAYADGYLKEARDILTKAELELLPSSIVLMTLECGMRFLADYIDGDIYFATERAEHNLDRARTQLRLVEQMEICANGGRLRVI